MAGFGHIMKRYPVGIQTFSEIIKGGYVYVDKTDLVWKLQRYAKFIFLSRPRRFGKSLLATTLHSFFTGQKDLFNGLKIMQYEKDWMQYPVIHLDLSTVKGQGAADDLRKMLFFLMMPLRKIYGEEGEASPGMMLAGLIRRAYEQTGKQVVVLIDEYDTPLLDVLHDNTLLEAYRNVLQEFYQPLKASEAMLRFCFLTGITRLSQMSVFSTLNNLLNITMDPQFAAICGITGTELKSQLFSDVESLAATLGYTKEETWERLKLKYDGYRFAQGGEEVYNPYSLFQAFQLKSMGNYWFESGTPTFLIRQMQKFGTDITAMDDIEATATAMYRPAETMTTALPLLYQAGYLTIKGYDRETDTYMLGVPNQEVRVGFADGLLPAYVGLEGDAVQMGFAKKFWLALKKNDLDGAFRELQAYLAGLPYVEGFKKKHENVSDYEGFYEWTFYLIFTMLNVYAKTQVKCAGGRIDMVVHMPETVYVFELKLNGSAKDALDQIDRKGYAVQYQTNKRKLVKAGLSFSSETKTLTDWTIV